MDMDDAAGETVERSEEPTLQLLPEAQARLFDQVMTTYIVPEIEARQARGEAPKPFQLVFAQIVFEADRPPLVRLNEECGVARWSRQPIPLTPGRLVTT
jgi:hypothetical protein